MSDHDGIGLIRQTLDNPLMSNVQCRFCDAPLVHTFVDLGMSPISNDYIDQEALLKREPFYPLRAYVCERCFLVQLPAYQDASEIFNDQYAYYSSYSDSWLRHAEGYVDTMMARFRYTKASQVVELASNDGYLLQYFKQRGVPVLGVEPSENVARAAEEQKGIPTVVKFFGVATARELVGANIRADLLIGNNVLAHVPDINDFVAGMKIILKPDGIVTLEFPHLMKMMELNQFDTIYHEHYSYLSFAVVQKIFSQHGMTLFDVDEIPTHGGSIRIYARHSEDGTKPVSERVSDLLAREEEAGYGSLQHYLNYQETVDKTKRELLKFLIRAKEIGKSVVGYGAPAKGNTLLNYCGIRSDFIDYTVDRSPYKQGRFLPGTHIPIYDPDKIRQSRPDYILILPWNLRDEIMEQMDGVREWGGKFVVPIPSVTIYD